MTPKLVSTPVPRSLSLLTDGTRMFVTSGVRDQVTGHAVLYLNNRAGNRAYVRDLLAQRQPALATLLNGAVGEHEPHICRGREPACTW